MSEEQQKPEEKPKYRLAVYGSLKAGYGNHGLIRGNLCLGGVWIDNFALVDEGNFPAAFSFPGRKIWAEVYEVDGETLAYCDKLEGYDISDPENSYYSRIIVDTEVYGNAYLYVQQKRTLVTGKDKWFPSGAWDGRNSGRVEWAGWQCEIRLRDDELRKREALGLDENRRPPVCAYNPPPRKSFSGNMVKEWSSAKHCWEYRPPTDEERKQMNASKALSIVGESKPVEPPKPTWRDVARQRIKEGMEKNPNMPKEEYM